MDRHQSNLGSIRSRVETLSTAQDSLAAKFSQLSLEPCPSNATLVGSVLNTGSAGGSATLLETFRTPDTGPRTPQAPELFPGRSNWISNLSGANATPLGPGQLWQHSPNPPLERPHNSGPPGGPPRGPPRPPPRDPSPGSNSWGHSSRRTGQPRRPRYPSSNDEPLDDNSSGQDSTYSHHSRTQRRRRDYSFKRRPTT